MTVYAAAARITIGGKNEACTRLLQRLQQMSQMQPPLRRAGQTPLANTALPNTSTLQPQTAPSRTSYMPGNDLPGTNPAAFSGPNNMLPNRSANGGALDDGTNPSTLSGPTNMLPNGSATRSADGWTIPDLLYSTTMNYRNPFNSNGLPTTWNTRQFSAAYRFPKTASDQPNSSTVGSPEGTTTNFLPRSLVSVLPGIMNAGTGLLPSLGSSLSRIPSDMSRDVTTSLSDVTQGVTSSLSRLDPTGVTSGVTSSLSNIPKAASDLSSGVTSALSPSNYLPSTLSSSIPGLIYLASSFADWMNSNSTASSTRSNLSSPFSFLSYIPGLLSAISVIAPFLPSFGSTSQPTPPTARSSLSAITSLPSSLLGLTGLAPSAGRNGPYGYGNTDSGRKDKSRVRPDPESMYYGNDLDHENDSKNEYADGNEDYRHGNMVDDRHRQSKKRPSLSQRIRNSQKPFAGLHGRGNRNQNLYHHEEDY